MKKLHTLITLVACGTFLVACSTQQKSDQPKNSDSSMMQKEKNKFDKNMKDDKMSSDNMKDDKMSDDNMKDDKMQDSKMSDDNMSDKTMKNNKN